MADIREQILTRLVTVCAGVTGIVSAGRNVTDVPQNARPAVLITGGAEQILARAQTDRVTHQKQTMELTPGIILLVRSDAGAEGGPLMSLFRSRLVSAILNDTTLRGLGNATRGGLRYEGCNEIEPTPESKEPRLELQIVFTYALTISDLAA